MNIFFLNKRLANLDMLFRKLTYLSSHYPHCNFIVPKTVRETHLRLLASNKNLKQQLTGKFGKNLLLSFIPATKNFQARKNFAKNLNSYKNDLHCYLTKYQSVHSEHQKNIVTVTIDNYLKTYFPVALKTLCLLVATLALLLASLIFLGSIAEGSSEMANVIALFAGKFLIGIFLFFAVKLPMLVLAKFAIITAWFSTISIKALVQPGNFWQTFTLKQPDVLFFKKYSLDALLKRNITFYNPRISLRRKVRYALNPVSWLIMGMNFLKGLLFSSIDSLPGNHDIVNKESPFLFRLTKGLISIPVECLLVPLRLCQAIASFPYDMVCAIVDIYTPSKKKALTQKKVAHKAKEKMVASCQTPAFAVVNSAAYITKTLGKN